MEPLIFLLALAIGIAILIVSMMITSNLMRGVEFGAVHIVIGKAAALLILVIAVSFIPPPLLGTILTLPVWWFGLMIAYRIDFWEARTLVVVNWLLNMIVRFSLVALLR